MKGIINMDCKHMIEINDKGLFQDLRTGLKYHEITKEMIEGCLDDEIAFIFAERLGKSEDEAYPVAKNLKNAKHEVYAKWAMDYMERNNIIALDCEEGVRYFEFDEDENDVR
jgi:hypothetical protein